MFDYARAEPPSSATRVQAISEAPEACIESFNAIFRGLEGVGCLARTRQHRCSHLAPRQAKDQPATRRTWWLLLTGAAPARRAQHLYLRAVSWLAREVVGLSGPTLRVRKNIGRAV